jgi:hypothetical protein
VDNRTLRAWWESWRRYLRECWQSVRANPPRFLEWLVPAVIASLAVLVPVGLGRDVTTSEIILAAASGGWLLAVLVHPFIEAPRKVFENQQDSLARYAERDKGRLIRNKLREGIREVSRRLQDTRPWMSANPELLGTDVYLNVMCRMGMDFIEPMAEIARNGGFSTEANWLDGEASEFGARIDALRSETDLERLKERASSEVERLNERVRRSLGDGLFGDHI